MMSKNIHTDHLNQSQPYYASNQQDRNIEFLRQLSKRYGIPLIQLKRIYNNQSAINPQDHIYKEDLDYGEKLVLNHNILKEMVQMINTKQYSFPSTRPSHLSHPQAKIKVQEKLKIVHEKLQEILKVIGKDGQKYNSPQKSFHFSDNNQGENYDQSLQYSKDVIQEPKNISQKFINIDRSKLDNAKQVNSQLLLNEHGYDGLYSDGMKSSLDRVSQINSGSTIGRKNDEQKLNKQESKRWLESKIYDTNANEELDETDRLIKQTISKKTIKTSTLKPNQSQIPSKFSEDNVKSSNSSSKGKDVIRQNFWKERSGKLDTLNKKYVISNESISQSRYSLGQKIKSHQFFKGFTFKSFQSLDKKQKQHISSQQIQQNSSKNTKSHKVNPILKPIFHQKNDQNQKVLRSNNQAQFRQSRVLQKFTSSKDMPLNLSPQQVGPKQFPKYRVPPSIQTAQFLSQPEEPSSKNSFGNNNNYRSLTVPSKTSSSSLPYNSLIRNPVEKIIYIPREQIPFRNQIRLNGAPRIVYGPSHPESIISPRYFPDQLQERRVELLSSRPLGSSSVKIIIPQQKLLTMPSQNISIKNEKRLKKRGIQLTNPSFIQKNYQF